MQARNVPPGKTATQPSGIMTQRPLAEKAGRGIMGGDERLFPQRKHDGGLELATPVTLGEAPWRAVRARNRSFL